MSLILFLLGVSITVFITYIFFRLFGVRSNNIFVSTEEKKQWDEKISGKLKSLLTVTNIFGTVTSLATLLFLAGSAKLFGIFAFATGLTFALSGFITNPITRKLLADKKIKERYDDNNQVGGVIASIFWSDNKEDKALSKLVKYISLFAIFSIIWLEVSLFSNFSSAYLHFDSIGHRTIIAGITFFVIFYFVAQYGLRGFVFADLFHTPVIIIMGLFLIGILISLLFKGTYTITPDTFVLPILKWPMAIVFFFHVLVLNVFQVICTEPHWFRLWLFKNIEITSQKKGVIATGVIWILLLFIGFSTFAITNDVGEPAIGALLNKLASVSPYFIFFFWIAATGALFSTVDTQLYSILLVLSYNTTSGALPKNTSRFKSPFSIAVYASIAFAIAYFAVKYFGLEFEKILLVVVPFSTVLLPLFIAKYADRQPSKVALIWSVVGYIVTAVIGFIVSSINFYATLSAIFFPVIVSLVVLIFTPKMQVEDENK